MVDMRLWLRWSWRDLRARWLQVVAIALIIALGTGVFAGLGGQQSWRIDSLDMSYGRLKMYDLQMQLADGSYVDQQALQDALSEIPGVDRFETRLIASTLVDASTEDQAVLVEGRIVSVDVSNGGPYVNKLFIKDGRDLTSVDAGTDAIIVESKFADYYGLEPGDPIRISGDKSLDFVGTGFGPEYFMIVPQEGSFLAESSFAVLFTTLETAQELAGREGLVNDVAFLLDDGADEDAVRAEISRRMASAFPDTGMTLNDRQDDWGVKQHYEDAKNDQGTWDMVALLFLVGAALGAFNLAGRIVEAQRRQIGISMALGLPRLWIALRPMLIGLQIAILGTIFGLFIGLGFSQMFASLFQSVMDLPYWEVTLYVPGFVQATVLGILLPFVATLIPVLRAVRVAPIDAIRTGNLISKGGGLSWLLSVIPIPGKSFTQMPFRNILRSPWRSLLTVLGIAMAIVLLVAFVGFLDSFLATMDQAESAYEYQSPDRLLVQLDFFYPTSNGEITAIRDLTSDDGSPLFTTAEPALMLGGKLIDGGDDIDIALELHDMDNAIWVPRLIKGQLQSDRPGIILSEKAADDLNVGVGDAVTLEHPQREGILAFRLVQDEVPVIGIHNNPLRALSYMDLSGAETMGLTDVTNMLVVSPAPGVTADDVKLALMTQPGVASVQAVTDFAKAIDEFMDLFVVVLRVVQGIVLLMAFLIAFNSTSINVDERVREISTMFAFGLPLRTVTRMQMLENLVIGVLGTVLGAIAGWYVLNAVLAARVEDQLADFQFVVTISLSTLVISALLGVLVVTLTPLLSIRRMLRMDIPSALRVME